MKYCSEIVLIPTESFCAYNNDGDIVNFLYSCVNSAFLAINKDRFDTMNFSENCQNAHVEIALQENKLPRYIAIHVIKKPKSIKKNNYYTVKYIYNNNVTFNIPTHLITENSSTILIGYELNKLTDGDIQRLNVLLDSFYSNLNNNLAKIPKKKKKTR